jgi:hypothetical protein
MARLTRFILRLQIISGIMGTMLFMKLSRPVRAVEIMTFTGNRSTETGNQKQQEAENFHRAPSIAARPQNATPNNAQSISQ